MPIRDQSFDKEPLTNRNYYLLTQKRLKVCPFFNHALDLNPLLLYSVKYVL